MTHHVDWWVTRHRAPKQQRRAATLAALHRLYIGRHHPDGGHWYSIPQPLLVRL